LPKRPVVGGTAGLLSIYYLLSLGDKLMIGVEGNCRFQISDLDPSTHSTRLRAGFAQGFRFAPVSDLRLQKKFILAIEIW
jgi:hypothetical protein